MMASIVACFLGEGLVTLVALTGAGGARLADGRELRLYGLESPGLWRERQAISPVEVTGEWKATVDHEWDPRAGAFVKAYWLKREGRILNVELVRAGQALAADLGQGGERGPSLARAAGEAQARGAGLWGERRAFEETERSLPGPFAGVALSMHSKEPNYDYARELQEIRALGATWVSLIVATHQERVDSSIIRPFEDPVLARIAATIERARDLGLEVLLMPIVLIEAPSAGDWRGTLAPRDRSRWWYSYDALLRALADVASVAGASAFVVGSELASLEPDEAAWRRVILNVRCRFAGALTYSANWDHFSTPRYWDALDFASMTAYFKLGEGPAPAPSVLENGWRRALAEVERLGASSELPVVLSEVGVPSVVGGAAAPWDYTRRGAPDPEAQHRTFEAFRRVFLPGGRAVKPFAGAFLYEWWGHGGVADTGYTARGKPAEEAWRRILSEVASDGVTRKTRD